MFDDALISSQPTLIHEADASAQQVLIAVIVDRCSNNRPVEIQYPSTLPLDRISPMANTYDNPTFLVKPTV